MFRTRNGAPCPHCRRGHIRQGAFKMVCDWCGHIAEQDPRLIPFSAIQVGETFYSGYDDATGQPPTAYKKIKRVAGPGENDSIKVEQPGLGARHGPNAPCIRARDFSERN